MPKGQAGNLARGWVNILGPNVFVPWDTHKRHLNYDREVIDLIRTHPAIKNLFENWSEAFQQISRLGAGEITKTINISHALLNEKTNNLTFGNSDRVPINATKKRGQKLPEEVFKPVLASVKKAKKDIGITLNLVFAVDDARRLAAQFHIHGSLEAAETKRALSDKAKEHLMGLLQPRRAKRS